MSGLLGSRDIVAFAATRDLARAREFYELALGLRCVGQDDFAVVFDANGTMLRITVVAEVVHPGYTVLGWRVDSIATTIHALAANGVQFTRYDGMDQDDDGVWTTPGGDKVAWFSDPDGNNLSLTQLVPRSR